MIHGSLSRLKTLSFDTLTEKPWLQHFVLGTFNAAILLACSLCLYLLILGGQRTYQLLWLGIALITGLVFLLVITARLEIFQAARKKWISVFLIASLSTITSFILQTLFLHGLGQLVGIKARLIAQAIFILLCLLFAFHLFDLPKSERTRLLLLVALVTGLFFLQWFTLANKLRWLKPFLALYASTFILGLPLFAEYTDRVWSWWVGKTGENAQRFAKGAAIILMLFLAGIYYQAAREHMISINKKINSSDQAFYIEFIKDVYESGFTSTGDHNRMPLYPYLQALFYRNGMSDKELFLQGKQINISLSLALLAVLFLVFLKRFPFFQAFLLILITAFSFFIFKAPYLQSEILFFSLSAISFLLMLQMLEHPTWPLALATGLAAGLAYLSKGTVLPAVILFALLLGGKQIGSALREARQTGLPKLRFVIQQAGLPLLFLLVFLVTIYPYIYKVKERFGSYFYNVNTTVYIWYEDFDQALEEEAKHHFTEQWPAYLPEDQIPGLRKYLREHTPQQIFDRFRTGVDMVLYNVFAQLGVTNYWLLFTAILLIVVGMDIRNALRTVRRYPTILLFILLYFGGYLVAFSWYSHIAGGRRFLFSLYIPFLTVVFIFMNALVKNQVAAPGSSQGSISLEKFNRTANIILLFTLLYNIWLIVTRVLFFGRYGS